jgi:hypothetical protein
MSEREHFVVNPATLDYAGTLTPKPTPTIN